MNDILWARKSISQLKADLAFASAIYSQKMYTNDLNMTCTESGQEG